MKVSLGTEELQTKALGNKPQVQSRGREEMFSGGAMKKANDRHEIQLESPLLRRECYNCPGISYSVLLCNALKGNIQAFSFRQHT